MEAIKSVPESQGETTGHEGGARDVLRGMVKRRLQRRAAHAVHHGKQRARAFGRGVALGRALQENPAKVAALTFAVGCLIGALGLGLTQLISDLQTIVDEESANEGEDSNIAIA